MIIDTHAHLWLKNTDACRRGILHAAELYDYRRVYVSTLGVPVPGEEEIAACNALTLSFMRDEPSLVRGWCYLNPANADTMTVLRRGIEDDGMTGVKLWIATFCDDHRVDPIAEYCVANRIPVLIHALDKTVGQYPTESRGVNVRNLALRYPELRIIMAHLGGNEYTGVRAVMDLPNVMIDICGVNYRADTLEYAVERVGVRRLLYGTDMSYDLPFWQVIGRVRALPIPEEDKQLIFEGNALAFGL